VFLGVKMVFLRVFGCKMGVLGCFMGGFMGFLKEKSGF
jgi:hypothetical protein